MRGVSLLIVVLIVLLMLIVTLGATGFSDRVLSAIVNEEVRGLRQSLAQTIRDPEALERVIAQRREELIRSYGLDKPWYLRIPGMLVRVLMLDLGEARTLRSFSGSSRVAEIVTERIPNTVILVTTASVITAVLGLLAGVKLAMRAGSRLDRAASYMSAVSNALPSWWLGILLLIMLVFYARLFPPGGLLSTPPPTGPIEKGLDILWHAALPILTLVLVSVGPWTYVARTMVLNTAQEDYVSVAKAKGLPEGLLMRRYVIRVAAPPILTNITLGIAASLGGAILTETVFNWPGMGRLYYDAILQADEAVIVALTFIFTLIYVAARFILEVLYVILDPRVRY